MDSVTYEERLNKKESIPMTNDNLSLWKKNNVLKRWKIEHMSGGKMNLKNQKHNDSNKWETGHASSGGRDESQIENSEQLKQMRTFFHKQYRNKSKTEHDGRPSEQLKQIKKHICKWQRDEFQIEHAISNSNKWEVILAKKG